MTDTPNIDHALIPCIDGNWLLSSPIAAHPPRILVLYGSPRARNFSRLAAEEAARILTRLGA